MKNPIDLVWQAFFLLIVVWLLSPLVAEMIKDIRDEFSQPTETKVIIE